jgi:hypothetical protein
MSNLSRRTLVTSAAALPALTVPVVASTDPIFGALARLKQVDTETSRLAAELDEAEGRAFMEHGHRPFGTGTEEKAWYIKAGLGSLWSESESAWDAHDEAWERLNKTHPTTPAGAAAFLDFIISDMENGTAERQDVALANISAALRAMGMAS